MELALSDDQLTILDAVDVLTRPYVSPPTDCRDFVLTSPELDAELVQGGFLDIAFDPDLGAISAALVVEKLARLPYATESAMSALVRPLLGELPAPICMVESDQLTRPVRFLKPGATVVVVFPDKVASFTATEADVVAVAESLYAYPVAKLASADFESRLTTHDVSADEVRTRWRLATATEIAGLLQAAVDSTVLYVSERKQFGRPIGVFQAVRHRLAEASVRAMGARWMALKAAYSGDAGETALAAHYAQDSGSKIVYDLHQFLGGMGITLEHPLHLWTYRIKSLLSDLGGRTAQADVAAKEMWAA
ncbi:acyl-CoA dehydrogenase family protein [Stakelama tenebrarum]|uniref:Acyl-CoA dehydrogenase n=1 Tax=Stakelama tenebrarum TaxID=2711215 RepID=A0A6G6Y767_9SPHN|nr:acyl-CoA dehydrogenase family protein [Sphingosinithalassobacter tenebrarum]QIG80765.1 acyl-CoA dehydrogenase [Sphingosinithalassobacter tenebrarum]